MDAKLMKRCIFTTFDATDVAENTGDIFFIDVRPATFPRNGTCRS